jgi:hypothetical protein
MMIMITEAALVLLVASFCFSKHWVLLKTHRCLIKSDLKGKCVFAFSSSSVPGEQLLFQ